MMKVFFKNIHFENSGMIQIENKKGHILRCSLFDSILLNLKLFC